jgi:hypothetical protein
LPRTFTVISRTPVEHDLSMRRAVTSPIRPVHDWLENAARGQVICIAVRACAAARKRYARALDYGSPLLPVKAEGLWPVEPFIARAVHNPGELI